PTSNVCLGVYPGYDAHPLGRLWDAGLMVTVNSDDPPMFGADLNREYKVLVRHFGFGAGEAGDGRSLEQVSLNGLQASFLPDADKARLAAEFCAQFACLREELLA
ncbi:MAG TPA: adenosine deaminase, partial [Chloroflexi bacterium]|nr:adenosine deaminase [Chloroflexota bacterium]